MLRRRRKFVVLRIIKALAKSSLNWISARTFCLNVLSTPCLIKSPYIFIKSPYIFKAVATLDQFQDGTN